MDHGEYNMGQGKWCGGGLVGVSLLIWLVSGLSACRTVDETQNFFDPSNYLVTPTADPTANDP